MVGSWTRYEVVYQHGMDQLPHLEKEREREREQERGGGERISKDIFYHDYSKSLCQSPYEEFHCPSQGERRRHKRIRRKKKKERENKHQNTNWYQSSQQNIKIQSVSIVLQSL